MTIGTNGPPVLNGSAYIYPSRTLSQMRDDLLLMLGFPDPLTDPDNETKTLAELRATIRAVLGFPDPLTAPDSETKTLVQLREIVYRRLGYYYVAGANPPGQDARIDQFINEAQQTIFRTVELDKAGVPFPADMIADSDPTEIDYVPVLALATGLAKAHAGKQDAQAYFEQMQKYLTDRAERNPPNLDSQITSWVNEAQQTIFRTVEFDKGGFAFPAEMVLETDVTEIDYVPVLAMSIGLAKSYYKQPDAKLYFEQFKKYLDDRILRRPPNITAMANKWLERAQYHCYYKYTILRTERWWSIPITQGNRIYDVPSISSGGLTDVSFDSGARTITRTTGSWFIDGFNPEMRIKASGASNAGNNDVQWTIESMTALVITLAVGDVVVTEASGATITISTANYMSLEFRKVSEAWLQDGNLWMPLLPGINPAMFNITQQTLPTRYEMREFFEVFPEPEKSYTAWIKGHYGLLPFTADNDKTTIDPEVILLQALVWGKSHYKQRDAVLYIENLKEVVGNLAAGTHAGKRYIPEPNRPEYPTPYPNVTGTGWVR